MRAVVFKEPYKVAIEERPTPAIQHPRDAIVKVIYTALCGSDLHVYRGLEHSPEGPIMGHEFIGVIECIGSDIKDLVPGDKVVSPFTISCGNCFYCSNGLSSRCTESLLFGSPALDGAQAEFVRVPLADSTLVKAPEGMRDEVAIFMGDIFPTGFYAAHNAFKDMTAEQRAESTVVVIGCGPVGLTALINAAEYKPKHLFAIDQVESRLELAQKLGAVALNSKTDMDGVRKRVAAVTDGRGADAVIEVVGLSPALKLAYDLVRPFGIISSVGVHNGEIPWTGADGYNKNLRVQMGRCPVRSIFPQALDVLVKKQDLLSAFLENIIPLSQAVEAYEAFDKMKVQKVIFKAQA